MPIKKAAAKALRQARKHNIRKSQEHNRLRDLIKKFRANKKRTAKDLQVLQKSLDKAAKHHTISKNKAARLKSRLAKLLKRVVPKAKAESKKQK